MTSLMRYVHVPTLGEKVSFHSGVAIGCAECARHTGPRPPGAHRRHTLIFLYIQIQEIDTKNS